jgi:hypothetical protein
MQNRLLAGGIVLAGIAVFIALINGNLFGIATEFEDMTDGFRPVMEDEALATAKQDVAALGAVSNEFGTAVMPALAGALQMDEAGLNQFMGQQFPAVAAGVQALPSIVNEFTGVVGLLESQQSNFETADQIPTSNLPATTMPWIILLVSLAILAVGIWLFLRPRNGSLIATVVGALIVIGVLVLSFIPKAEAADDMNDALKPVYNAAMVEGAGGALQVVGGMGQEMQTAMLPGLQQQLGLSQEELVGFLSQFPATAGALESLPVTMGRFQGLVATFDTELSNYEAVQDTALTPIAWTVLIGGLATFLFGGYAYLIARREPS